MTDLQPLERDQLLAEVRHLLPVPVREETQLDGSLLMIGGDPGEVVVRVVGSRVTVALFAAKWEGPHSLMVRPMPMASLNWKYLPASRMMMALHTVIESARELRRNKYRKCEHCGETKPPECMHDENTCDCCAERYLGVIH